MRVRKAEAIRAGNWAKPAPLPQGSIRIASNKTSFCLVFWAAAEYHLTKKEFDELPPHLKAGKKFPGATGKKFFVSKTTPADAKEQAENWARTFRPNLSLITASA